jgi:hypothetical protein
VTTFTGGSGRQLISRGRFFARVSTGNVVLNPVPVTIDTGQACFEVNILVASPFLRSLGAYVKVRVAEVASVRRNFSENVKEDKILAVEDVLVIRDGRRRLSAA